MKARVSIFDRETGKAATETMNFEHLPRVGEYIFWRSTKNVVTEIIHDIDNKIIVIKTAN